MLRDWCWPGAWRGHWTSLDNSCQNKRYFVLGKWECDSFQPSHGSPVSGDGRETISSHFVNWAHTLTLSHNVVLTRVLVSDRQCGGGGVAAKARGVVSSITMTIFCQTSLIHQHTFQVILPLHLNLKSLSMKPHVLSHGDQSLSLWLILWTKQSGHLQCDGIFWTLS